MSDDKCNDLTFFLAARRGADKKQQKMHFLQVVGFNSNQDQVNG